MQPQIKFSDKQLEDLEMLATVDEILLNKMAEGLKSAPLGSIRTVYRHVVKFVTVAELPNLFALLNLLVGLYALRLDKNVESDNFADIVSNSVPAAISKATRARLKPLLDDSQVLEVCGKADDVLYDNDTQFSTCRVLTDFRPIFSTRSSELLNIGGTVHFLKIEYFKNYEEKEFFVALDKSDLEQLAEVIGRALEKDEAIQKRFESMNMGIIT